MAKSQEKKVKIFPWGESATKRFSPQELLKLRDWHPHDIAEGIWPPGRVIQADALNELAAHGNLRKAALVARRLVDNHPVCEESLKEDIGGDNYRFLIDTPILELPG